MKDAPTVAAVAAACAASAPHAASAPGAASTAAFDAAATADEERRNREQRKCQIFPSHCCSTSSFYLVAEDARSQLESLCPDRPRSCSGTLGSRSRSGQNP